MQEYARGYGGCHGRRSWRSKAVASAGSCTRRSLPADHRRNAGQHERQPPRFHLCLRTPRVQHRADRVRHETATAVPGGHGPRRIGQEPDLRKDSDASPSTHPAVRVPAGPRCRRCPFRHSGLGRSPRQSQRRLAVLQRRGAGRGAARVQRRAVDRRPPAPRLGHRGAVRPQGQPSHRRAAHLRNGLVPQAFHRVRRRPGPLPSACCSMAPCPTRACG